VRRPTLPARDPFQYLVLRIVPDVERGEAVNAGVVVYCRAQRYLAAKVQLPAGRLGALAPELEQAPVRAHLDLLAAVAAGDADAGPLARQDLQDRFGWLAAPSSTVVQPSPVHTGMCSDPAAELERLFDRLVGPAGAADTLASMRETYARQGLGEDDLAPDWLAQAERWVTEAVAAGVHEPSAMVLATANAAGRPTARTVLLKGLDERGFVLFTNRASRKGREALANPRAALVLPWLALQRQILVTGAVSVVSEEESDAYWATRPHGSQVAAAASPQSTVVGSREELEARWAAVQDAHPSEPVPRPPHWGGLRVAPDAVELWQGRPNRLHDRLRYRRTDAGAWVVERLAP
jgi:pyridoxamine 5'-phosphate oxidase